MVERQNRSGGRAVVGAALRAGVVGSGAASVALAATALLAAVGPGPRGAVRSLHSPPAGTTADVLVADAVALGAWAVAVWLCAGVLLTVLGRLPGAAGRGLDGVARRVTPAVVRRLVGTALGAALTTTAVVGSAGTALAADRTGSVPVAATATALGHSGTAWGGPAARGADLGRLPDLDRPSAAPAPPPAHVDPAALVPAAQPTAQSGADRAVDVVVVRGDTLWGLARRHLPPGASDAEIGSAWRRWWAANRDVVGPDPDLLIPGQVLQAPQGP